MHQILRRVTPGINSEHEAQMSLHFTTDNINPDTQTCRELIHSRVTEVLTILIVAVNV